MSWDDFRKYFATIGPPWTRRYFGERLWGTVGLYCDLLAQGATEAVRASWLKSNTVPADALPIFGSERRIPRVPPDTNAQYRERLFQAWDLWEDAGTPSFGDWVFGPWGIDPANVYARSYAADGWCVGGAWCDISRFSLLITDPDPPWTQAVWGTFPVTWGSGTTWGSSATDADVQAVYKLVWLFKAAHEVPIGVVLAWGWCWGWGVYGALPVWGTQSIRWNMGQFWGGGGVGHYGPATWGGPMAYTSTTPPTPARWGGRIHH